MRKCVRQYEQGRLVSVPRSPTFDEGKLIKMSKRVREIVLILNSVDKCVDSIQHSKALSLLYIGIQGGMEQKGATCVPGEPYPSFCSAKINFWG